MNPAQLFAFPGIIGFALSTLAQSYPLEQSAGGSRSADILVFAIPFLQFVQLHVGGILYGSELLLLTVFLWCAGKGRLSLSTRNSEIFIVLCSLWFISQCVTDVVRHTEFVDFSRGWSRILMTIVSFSVLYMLLYGRPQRIVVYGWGLAAGGLITFLVNPSEYDQVAPWKFGLSYPVAWAVFLLLSRQKCRGHWPITISVMLGLLNIYEGSRSLGGICLAVASYLWMISMWRRKHTGTVPMSAKFLLIVFLSIALAGLGTAALYRYAASSGLLGEFAQNAYEQQSTGDYGVLLGGRSAILGSIPAIYDSPILGHGSWARDPIYVLAQIEALYLAGYDDTSSVENEELEEGYVPAHSYIFGAWVEAGILGAICWVWVLLLAVRVLLRVFPSRMVLHPLVAFCAISLTWDSVFSPYGAQARIIVPYYLVMLMTYFGMVPRKVAPVAAELAHGGSDIG